MIINYAGCPLCGHVPIWKEDPKAEAPTLYYCHGCDKGFNDPAPICGTCDNTHVLGSYRNHNFVSKGEL